jgi:alpha-beta hydrolase superfamily lysophospholipase
LFSHKERYLEELYTLARSGFKATAIDLSLHGDGPLNGSLESKFAGNYIEAMQAVIYETAAGVSRLLDEWESEENSVGLYGVSAGGLVAHAAAVSDTRIGAIAAIISSPDWLTADSNIVPAQGSPLREHLEHMSPVNSAALYVPKALLMLVGEQDSVIAPSGSRLLYERLLPLYRDLGIEDQLRLKIYPELGHVYSSDMRDTAVNWMIKNLIVSGH